MTKRDVILNNARDLFLAHGFDGTSIDRIAESARVSRQTIYNNFESKEALFRELAGALADHVVQPLLDEEPHSDDIEVTLTALAERGLPLAVLPESLALHRLVVAEAPKFPDVARQIYENGPARAAKALAAYLKMQDERGVLDIKDPELAAEHFFGMLLGHRQFRALLGVEERRDLSDTERAAELARAFIRAYRR